MKKVDVKSLASHQQGKIGSGKRTISTTVLLLPVWNGNFPALAYLTREAKQVEVVSMIAIR